MANLTPGTDWADFRCKRCTKHVNDMGRPLFKGRRVICSCGEPFNAWLCFGKCNDIVIGGDNANIAPGLIFCCSDCSEWLKINPDWTIQVAAAIATPVAKAFNPLEHDADYFLPIRHGCPREPESAEAMAAALAFFQEKLLSALGIPRKYFDTSAEEVRLYEHRLHVATIRHYLAISNLDKE